MNSLLAFALFGLVAGAPDTSVARLARLRSCGELRPMPRGCEFKRRPCPGVAVMRSSTDSVIRPDFPVNDDTSGGCSNADPTIAVDNEGNLLVAWYDFREGDADVWYALLDENGRTLGPNRRANDDAGLGWQGEPASCATGARSLIVWHDRREIGNGDLFGQFLNAGVPSEGNFRVSDSGVPGDQIESGCWIAPSGVGLVAWDDRRFGLTGDIFAQFLSIEGRKLDTNFRVNDDPVGMANQYQPDVTGDSAGRFVVAWMDGRGRNPSDWNVFVQLFNADRSRRGTNIQVTVDDSIQWAPRVACAPAGTFAVVWEDRRRGQWDVFGQLYRADGTPIGGNFLVNDDAGTTSQYAPAVSTNGYGEFLVVWVDQRSGGQDIYARRLDGSGVPIGPSFRVSSETGILAGRNQPAVAALPDGGWWVVWSDAREGNTDILGRRVSRAGVLIGNELRINDDTASSQQRISSIGLNAGGARFVAWEDERSGVTDLYGQLIGSNGMPSGQNRKLNDDSDPNAAQYYAAVAGGRDRFFVAWSDGRNGWHVYAQIVDASGQPVGGNFMVNAYFPGASQWYPFVAMDTSDRTVVCWMDTRRGVYQVFRRQFDRNGSPIGDDVAVIDDSAVQGIYGSVAVNMSGRCVVTWMDYRSGNPEIYCQLYSADGNRIGANRRVSNDGGRYNGYPACAVAEDGRIAIAWEQLRSDGWYGVNLQMLDSSGSPVGPVVHVDDRSGNFDCYSASVDFDEEGRLVVVFNDERRTPGSPEIYCQRYRMDGTPIGGNRQVSDDPVFPHNHHWTIGQSVAANRTELTFTWTDNRRRRGFDIYAKVTDWEVVGLGSPFSGFVPEQYPPATLVRRGERLVHLPAGSFSRIYDAAGRCIARASTELCAPSAPGTYFVVASCGSDRLVSKLIVR